MSPRSNPLPDNEGQLSSISERNEGGKEKRKVGKKRKKGGRKKGGKYKRRIKIKRGYPATPEKGG